ncbi:1-phosphatidylinositol 4,5-bisphosphate phosphodiesterase delta-4-like isoform X2 [Periplaneta americana]|uniref:1-phosphatidylinositol 4,5-bisphosphate phosphodiesterase delta-4-like isoform X2 n=1 Tax=Periplaneta americana TaxID=6978 RepID=UPI0037E87115
MDEIVEETANVKLYPGLEETPEFREAIDSRSKTVEDVLETLKKGTLLWKVRSFSNWYRRKYVLDDKNGCLRYEPSHKAPCINAENEIVVDDIVDVRKGWKTDIFNKIERTVQKKRTKASGRKAMIDEASCFSVIHGRSKQTLDLVAPNPEVADLWVRGLRHLITVLHGLQQEERFERWLKLQFQEADVDKNGSLNFEECIKLLKQLNVKLPKHTVRRLFDSANTNKNMRNGEQVLDSEEFVTFYMNLMSRSEVKELFTRYSKNGQEMSAQELLQFIQKEQHCKDFTIEQCNTLIETFEQSQLKQSGKASLIGFTSILMSKQFEVFNLRHTVVYQDMTYPLSHYYIASSHNTYLTGNQLSGESSVEGYIDALKRGCRCVELDCWDGPEGDPIIYHGYTLTSKILFRDVLVDAIKPYAFYTSEYPVILSLENHCSEQQQEVLAKHLRDILEDMLYTEAVTEDMPFLPSPEALKRKVIVKAKKLSAKPNESESDDEEDADRPGMDVKANASQKKKVVAEGLSSLVNICQAVHFHGFQEAKTNGKCYQMSSFSEAKAQDLIEKSGKEFVQYNARQLSRIYPSGTRTGSSNYKPTPLWNVGCQIVALNYQSSRRPIFLNESKFRQNGGCGYVLKPKYLCGGTDYDPNAVGDRPSTELKLTIISGQHIPKADQNLEGEVVDPYVVVKVVGHPADAQKSKTNPIRNNGFNPRWDHQMTFTLKRPELAMLHFIVKDSSTTGKDAMLGMYALPFNSIEPGYRHIYLLDYMRTLVSPATLFVHVSIS